MLWPTIICIVAGIVFGVPFTYYWLRWSDKNAVGREKRFAPKAPKQNGDVRVIRGDAENPAGGEQ